tara:strand:+ start:232 stop:1416 length:1185 start_codon:yes stop_codon:yes gene_type:complete
MSIGALAFRTAGRLVYGKGTTSQVGELLGGGSGAKHTVLVVTDAMMVQLGLVDKALDALTAAGHKVEVYDEIYPDPSEESIYAATAAGRKAGCDAVVGFGGGSPMDAAKLVAFLLKTERPAPALEGMWGVHAELPGGRTPLALIPTTAGTGSEVTPLSIITTTAGPKLGLSSPTLLPDVAILDSSLTMSVPPAVTAATGIDAMVHAIEAYTSRLQKNQISDALAKDALKLLAGSIHGAVENGAEDEEARSNMLLGSCMAGMAFAHAPVAAVHALAYPIGVDFGVPHGYSNALVLPHVLRFNSAAAAPLYAELAPICFPTMDASRDAAAVSAEFAERYADLSDELGLEMGLRAVGVTAEDVEKLANDAMLQQRLLPNNPREVTLDDARALYTAAL